MMVETGLELHSFDKQLKAHFLAFKGEEELKRVRTKARDLYLEKGLPTRKHENYRTVKLRSLYSLECHLAEKKTFSKKEIASYILPECDRSHLVFINGFFVPELSNRDALPEGIVLTTLSEAMQSYGTLLNNHWARLLKEEPDSFALLNLALHPQGAFLYAPPKTVVETPIQILHLIQSDQGAILSAPRLNVFLGNQAQLNFIHTQHILSDSPSFCNQVFEFDLGEDAHLQFTQLLIEEPAKSFHFDFIRSTLKKNATFKTVSVTQGSAGTRNDYRVSLCGENSEALLNGLAILEEKREAHTNIWIEHQAPHCRSYQLFKSVLYDTSRFGFEGKILVRKPAQKTEAFQLNNNLLMSDHAHVDSKPNLEIFADDVKASHGATVGQLDAEQLFYMRSRGFSQDQAKQILVNGFSQQILDLIQVPSAQQISMERLQTQKRCENESSPTA